MLSASELRELATVLNVLGREIDLLGDAVDAMIDGLPDERISAHREASDYAQEVLIDIARCVPMLGRVRVLTLQDHIG